MKFRFRFTLRFVLLAVLVVACLLALWRARPTPFVRIELSSAGSIRLGGDELTLAALPRVLERESAHRRRWWVESHIVLRADPSASTGDVMEIIELGKKAGFERFSFAALEKAQSTSLEQ